VYSRATRNGLSLDLQRHDISVKSWCDFTQIGKYSILKMQSSIFVESNENNILLKMDFSKIFFSLLSTKTTTRKQTNKQTNKQINKQTNSIMSRK
jgi:hypothetical protein